MLWAKPQRAEPTIKSVIPNRKIGLRPTLSANLPKMGVDTVVMNTKMATTQFIIFKPFRLETIVGIAVETIVPSIAVIKVVKNTASVMTITLTFFKILPP